ncbi:glycerate dehydrogenase [Biscogniauxia marginata]|nr:glycerate dehydrogenase [Biscogniauxia marginata]
MATDKLKLPKQLPSSTHEVIVLLEEVYMTVEDLDTSPRSHELISYHHVTKPHRIETRIQCASIVIAVQASITSESMGEAPYLKCIIAPGVGTDHIDLDECHRRGIRVVNSPGSTSLAVSEHALGLYFAARRKMVTLHHVLRDVDENGENVWKREGNAAGIMRMANGKPPAALGQEVAGIFGYGFIGKHLATLCKSLGMKVLISERKKSAADTAPPPTRIGDGGSNVTRIPFGEVVRSATVLFITCPLAPETLNMIDSPEFEVMRPEVVVVNVSRGGVVNSAALIRALRENRISGAAVDVYDKEPASSSHEDTLLAEESKSTNLTLSPHVGYFSGQTVLALKNMTKEHISNYISGNEDNFVV